MFERYAVLLFDFFDTYTGTGASSHDGVGAFLSSTWRGKFVFDRFRYCWCLMMPVAFSCLYGICDVQQYFLEISGNVLPSLRSMTPLGTLCV